MFTGIIQGLGKVIQINDNTNKTFRRLKIALPESLTSHLTIGASIANNGCCLTVTEIDSNKISFDVMQETLKLTNLGSLSIGDWVNIERAAKFGDEIGGHLMSGHITCMASIQKIVHTADNCSMLISLPQSIRDYVLYKGFIGIDGISLTVGKVEHESFYLHLIPETLSKTILKFRQEGDYVNIEIDPQTQAIVNTVKEYMATRH